MLPDLVKHYGEWEKSHLAADGLFWQTDDRDGMEVSIGGKGHRGKDYNHSAYCDLIITGLAGLRPRADAAIEVNPLLPDEAWDWFCLDGIPYRGRSLTILYDKIGTRYGKGRGLVVLADGEVVASAARPGKIVVR